MTQRKSLSDILHNGDQEALARAWGETKAAEDFVLLPAAWYVCHLLTADPFNAEKKGTPGVKLCFKLLEGEYAGRKVFHDCWLTPAALAQTKRDLVKLGITTLEQLESPPPQGIRCRVKLVVRKADDGTEYNQVKRFDVLGYVPPPPPDPFAPADTTPAPQPPAADESAGGGRDAF